MVRVLMVLLLALAACDRPAGAPPEADAGPAALVGNRTCPVSGEPVAGDPHNPTFRSTFRGQVIGFMCPMHLKEFEDAPDAKKVQWLERARQDAQATRAR
ncbi:MAG: hypothetical protein HY904_00895 [Deltaproteobacteria bacterium]|nr:hypothetical protein [Deltaproteobacteria bacterium]